jgi:broad specificity phosphatase PhoE
MHSPTQCEAARKKVEGLQPDLILVSPLNRTLATCHEIFGGKAVNVVALPILAEGLRNACDFSIPV